MTTTGPRSTVAFWNVEHGTHLDKATKWLAGQNLDLLFWAELQPDDLRRVEKALGMIGYPAVETPVSANSNAIFLRPDGPYALAAEHRDQHRRAPWHPKANIQVSVRDDAGTALPGLLTLVAEHSCYWGPATRVIEAEWYSTVIKKNGRVLAMGDWNSYPVGETPDLSDITDLAHLHDRTWVHPVLGRIPDTRADEDLTVAGYTDLARDLANRTSDFTALTPTAGYGKPGQGGEQRIDRAYADLRTAGALLSFDAVRGLEQISDHRPLLAVFDLDRLRDAVCKPVARETSR
ncbi:hypothetical protein ACWC5I_10615 [Kitasatospora sp. NPDC001574]